jgi:hypothetical protein
MNHSLAQSRISVTTPAAERAPIDALAVNSLFDRLFDVTRDMADRFGKPIHFEVIAWTEFSVAANAEALVAALNRALRWCVSSEDTQSVTVRAYPCHDDVWAVFDIQADLFADEKRQDEVWKPTLCALRAAVQRMGGEWEPIVTYSACRRITFRLPQWVGADDALSLSKLYA